MNAPVKCRHCGREFSPQPGTSKVFCSDRCQNANVWATIKQRRAIAFAASGSCFDGKDMSPWLDRFVSEIAAKYPPLTPLEEEELFRNEKNSDHIRFLLTMHNAKFAKKIANEQRGMFSCLDADDLFSVCMCAIWKAAGKYEPNRGVRFISYAGNAARNAVFQMTQNAEFIRERLSMSLDERLTADDNSSEQMDVIYDRIDPGSYVMPFDAWLERRDMVEFANRILDAAIKARTKDVDLFLRWVNGETLTAIARHLGVSRERIRQRVERATERVHQTGARVLRLGRSTTDYDRIAACVKSRHKVVVDHHESYRWRLFFAIERFELARKKEMYAS